VQSDGGQLRRKSILERYSSFGEGKQVELGETVRALKLSFCALQLLTAPVRMRGWQGIFHLDPSVTKRAIRNLQTSPSPRPIRFTDHVPSETLQRARSSSRGRGYQSRGKENDGFGTGLSSQSDNREGGTNWEAVLPPRAQAARAALAASMGRGRPSQAKEDRWQGTEAVRGRSRARLGNGAFSGTVLPAEEADGFRVGPSGGARAAVGVQQGREGKRAGGWEGGRDGSEKYPRPESDSASAVQSCEEQQLGMGRAEEKQARDATEMLRSWTRVGTSEEGGTKMDLPGDEAELDSRVQNGNGIGSKPPPQAESSTPLDADAWPVLGGKREASSDALMSPRSVVRKRRSEVLVEGSCGATPWLERVRIGKGPRLTEPESSEHGVDRQALVPRQLRKKSAVISDQLR
jgi:hypothetical protein